MDETFYSSLNSSTNNLIVLDDKMSSMGDSALLSKLFTEGSHHRNLSVIYIVQNLFDKGKSHRCVSLNAQYLVLFKNPRDTAGMLMAIAKREKDENHAKPQAVNNNACPQRGR